MENRGNDQSIVFGWYETLFNVAGTIQPAQKEAFNAAERLTEQIEKGVPPDKIRIDDVEKVFRAAGRDFHRKFF